MNENSNNPLERLEYNWLHIMFFNYIPAKYDHILQHNTTKFHLVYMMHMWLE
ncbi:hypothetical protein ACJX0J_007005, partial [Zea mays]